MKCTTTLYFLNDKLLDNLEDGAEFSSNHMKKFDLPYDHFLPHLEKGDAIMFDTDEDDQPVTVRGILYSRQLGLRQDHVSLIIIARLIDVVPRLSSNSSPLVGWTPTLINGGKSD